MMQIKAAFIKIGTQPLFVERPIISIQIVASGECLFGACWADSRSPGLVASLYASCPGPCGGDGVGVSGEASERGWVVLRLETRKGTLNLVQQDVFLLKGDTGAYLYVQHGQWWAECWVWPSGPFEHPWRAGTGLRTVLFKHVKCIMGFKLEIQQQQIVGNERYNSSLISVRHLL